MTLLDCLPIILYFVGMLRFCVITMKVCARQFNIYLALAMAFALFCGCATGHHRSKAEKQADKKIGALRVHLDANANDTGLTQTISLLRADPVQVTIMRDPILTEANIL